MSSATRTLEVILQRIVPGEDGTTALAHDVGPSVRALVPELDELLRRLEGFEMLDEAHQDASLRSLDEQGDPVFAALVTAAQSCYYADARSWPTLGYTTHLPGRP